MKTRVCPTIINKATNKLTDLEAEILDEGYHDGDDENCDKCGRRFRFIDKLAEARRFPETMHNEVERIEEELELLTNSG